jgi:hypothetical protein
MLNNREDIESWLKKYNIKNYTINDDLTVDVNGSVYISNTSLKEIPIQFNIVNGVFDCSHNELTSLKGCPKEVNGSFYCYNNKLTSLESGPTEVRGNFDCDNNELTSLDYLSRININSIYSDFPKEYVLDFFIKNRPEDLI